MINTKHFSKITLISLTILILLVSVVIGHYLPPTEILIIPIVITLTTGIIVFTNNELSILVKSILSYLFIGLNDIGIKLFAAGIHDLEGIGWIHMLLFIGLVPCFTMLLIGVTRDKHSTISLKVSSIVAFILLMIVHLEIFKNLGVSQT